MSDLKNRICELIALNGPIRVSTFMSSALGDDRDGYYKHEKPFGKNGDFVTAPEISQMFGELIGVFVVESWQALDKPPSFTLCELGPGRGTLMQDLLRTVKKLSSACFAAAQIFMVETSRRLSDEQRKNLQSYKDKIRWVADFNSVSGAPLIVVANEFFDALPIDQFVKEKGNWHERLIATDGHDNLIFVLGQNVLDQTTLSQKYNDLPDGTILELAPLRLQYARNIFNRLAKSRGSALFIDYGSENLPYGDTLQAVSKHRYQDIFDAPGQHDLTSHVDFSSLRVAAAKDRCVSALLSQSEFLVGLGLLERAGQLGANKSREIQEKIRADVERLAGADQMGEIFKVLAVVDEKTGLHPIFSKGHLAPD
ncbi:class I SAM-dependent methyltransferase [uncultured Bartonella sp.]|uniref:class I SAM-dependent methyltransferase n=1 Tax=uncultured Bartonella sp. TaxID=104108 RepID=UPI0026097475|nr:class I SAM-dependent methyltransferase [uncultured Bartonella sp.]